MANEPVRILGLDPGLRRTGWGVIAADGSRLRDFQESLIEIKRKRGFAP